MPIKCGLLFVFLVSNAISFGMHYQRQYQQSAGSVVFEEDEISCDGCCAAWLNRMFFIPEPQPDEHERKMGALALWSALYNQGIVIRIPQEPSD